MPYHNNNNINKIIRRDFLHTDIKIKICTTELLNNNSRQQLTSVINIISSI